MPRRHFACQPTDADRRWSVIGFKLQKQESSFKHLLFTAFAKMWRGTVKRAHGMLFPPPPKDAGKSSRDFTEGPQTARFIWLLRKPDLSELTAVSNILLCFSWTIWEKNKAWFFCLSAAECVLYSPSPPPYDHSSEANLTFSRENVNSIQKCSSLQLLLYFLNYKYTVPYIQFCFFLICFTHSWVRIGQ